MIFATELQPVKRLHDDRTEHSDYDGEKRNAIWQSLESFGFFFQTSKLKWVWLAYQAVIGGLVSNSQPLGEQAQANGFQAAGVMVPRKV